MTREAEPMSETDVLSFECPRCATTVAEAYYGPCASCRDLLRQANEGRARDDLEVAEYEPKMNVTPNAVALKDD